jgi:hypothetical protein
VGETFEVRSLLGGSDVEVGPLVQDYRSVIAGQ